METGEDKKTQMRPLLDLIDKMEKEDNVETIEIAKAFAFDSFDSVGFVSIGVMIYLDNIELNPFKAVSEYTGDSEGVVFQKAMTRELKDRAALSAVFERTEK